MRKFLSIVAAASLLFPFVSHAESTLIVGTGQYSVSHPNQGPTSLGINSDVKEASEGLLNVEYVWRSDKLAYGLEYMQFTNKCVANASCSLNTWILMPTIRKYVPLAPWAEFYLGGGVTILDNLNWPGAQGGDGGLGYMGMAGVAFETSQDIDIYLEYKTLHVSTSDEFNLDASGSGFFVGLGFRF